MKRILVGRDGPVESVSASGRERRALIPKNGETPPEVGADFQSSSGGRKGIEGTNTIGPITKKSKTA